MRLYKPIIDYNNNIYSCIVHSLFYCLSKTYDIKDAEIHYLKFKKEFDLIIKKFNSYYSLPDDGQGLKWFSDLLVVTKKFIHPLDLEILFSPILEEYVDSKLKGKKFDLVEFSKIMLKIGINIQVTDKVKNIIISSKEEKNTILVKLMNDGFRFSLGSKWEVDLPPLQIGLYKSLKLKQALLYNIYTKSMNINSCESRKDVATHIIGMMYKHHTEQCGVAGFKSNMLLIQQKIIKEKLFLHKLRITKARLERHKDGYLNAGMLEKKYNNIYKAIDGMSNVVNDNVNMLKGIESSTEVFNGKEDFAEIKKALEIEKISIENKMSIFLSTEHLREVEEKLISIVETSCLGEILVGEVKDKDFEWACDSHGPHKEIDVEEVLLSRVCKDIATHIIDYYELCENLKEHGFNLNLELLQDVVLSCSNAYSLRLQYMDKVNLDKDVVELIKQLNVPFYDRAKHKSFKDKRDRVVSDIFVYIKNHHKELKDSKLNELGDLIVNLLIQNEMSKNKLDEIIIWKVNFCKSFFKKLKEELKQLSSEDAFELENTIKSEVAVKLGIDVEDLISKVGEQTIMKLAEKN